MAELTSLLFAPPRPPIALTAGQEVVIGRHPDCTILVASAQASRRHAVVRCRGDAIAVEDLGSTNGTFVNGRQIEGLHELEPGDRIEVGDVQVTYCVVESAAAIPASADPDQTVVSFRDESRPATETLEGDLARIPIFAVLQMLEMEGQSGRLDVESGEASGGIWIDSGRLVHATTDQESGMEAALALARVETGRFSFAQGEASSDPSFLASVTEVLLESSRLLDEESA